jgi:hypothetical protein
VSLLLLLLLLLEHCKRPQDIRIVLRRKNAHSKAARTLHLIMNLACYMLPHAVKSPATTAFAAPADMTSDSRA